MKDILHSAGITLNGDEPYDIIAKEKDLPAIFADMMSMGETYMDGLWSTDDLATTFHKLITSKAINKLIVNKDFSELRDANYHDNMQTPDKVSEVADVHYNMDTNFFEDMLGDPMIYTTGYWENTDNYEEAQWAKADLVCQKLHLKEGMTILDLGCGWGGFAKYAQDNYGVNVTGVTIAEEQAEYIRNNVDMEVIVQDYRKARGKYDRVVSLGLMEHIGWKNYRAYMKTVWKCLKDDGISLYETIGVNTTFSSIEPWYDKYIFPNGQFPSLSKLIEASETLFSIDDVHVFDNDYERTALAWSKNLEDNKHKYDEQFFRMIQYYLLSFAANFRCRRFQNWQVTFSKRLYPMPNYRNHD